MSKSKNALEQKRLLILDNRGNGKTIKEISQTLSCSRSLVTHTVSSYMHSGIKSALCIKRTGHHQYLSLSEESELLGKFKNESEAGKMLVVSDIQKAYEEKAGKKVALSTVYRMLARHDWRKIMPRSKHPKKANEESNFSL